MSEVRAKAIEAARRARPTGLTPGARDRTGEVFGGVEVIRFDSRQLSGGKRRQKWLTRCLSCGVTKLVTPEFLDQKPRSCGCLRNLGVSPKRKQNEGRVYFIEAVDGGFVKIGWSCRPLQSRLAALQSGCPLLLVIRGEIAGTMATERLYHKRFASLRVRPNGEWFRNDGELASFINELSVNRMTPET